VDILLAMLMWPINLFRWAGGRMLEEVDAFKREGLGQVGSLPAGD